MKDSLLLSLNTVLGKLGVDNTTTKIEYPEDLAHGDYSTNVAMANARKLGMSPKALAEKIVAELNVLPIEGVMSISIAGPGFINFTLDDKYVARTIIERSNAVDGVTASEGSTAKSLLQKKDSSKILIEHTDPNAFKAFHIGHLMANAIGESLSRIIGVYGAKVTKMCYPSDIGLHIAKSVWAMMRHEAEIPDEVAPIIERTTFLGKMYAEGTKLYEDDVSAKVEIESINRILYGNSGNDDGDTNSQKSELVKKLYEMGKRWSFEHYEMLYKRLGTKFDDYIYESEAAPIGKKIVLEQLEKGIFEKSEGAVVFKGEEFGLHTRVFLNSAGLTTYEAKDIGLNVEKFRKYTDIDESIIVTASEQNEYFKVIKKALTLIDKNVGDKTTHIGHGMMRFASGKMSSRTGNVITAESLIGDLKEMVMEKIHDKEFGEAEKNELADMIAIGAIKYTILRQSIGSDIIFDSASSISFEGDSGPYLQYSTVRARAIMNKAKDVGIKMADSGAGGGGAGGTNERGSVTSFEKLLIRFPEIIERSYGERAPQIVAGYLTTLAGAFNSFYAGQVIVNPNDPLSAYYVSVTNLFANTMEYGLHLLGIKVPDRM